MLDYYDDRNKEEESLLDEEITMTLDSRTQNPQVFNW